MAKRRFILFEIEPSPSGLGITGVLGILFIILVYAAFKSDPDGHYKIKDSQTAYPLRTSSVRLSSNVNNSPYCVSNGALAWYEDIDSDTQTLNGYFRRITGTIAPPTGSGENSDGQSRSIPEYWASYDAPKQALDYDLWGADWQETLWNTAREDLSRLSASLPSFCIEFHGDGKLLYRTPPLLYQTEPFHFDVNTEGVQELTITWRYLFVRYGTRYGHSYVHLYDLTGHTN